IPCDGRCRGLAKSRDDAGVTLNHVRGKRTHVVSRPKQTLNVGHDLLAGITVSLGRGLHEPRVVEKYRFLPVLTPEGSTLTIDTDGHCHSSADSDLLSQRPCHAIRR